MRCFLLVISFLSYGTGSIQADAQAKLDNKATTVEKAATRAKLKVPGGKAQYPTAGLPVAVASQPLEYDTVFTARLPLAWPEAQALRQSAKKIVVVDGELFYRVRTTDTIWIKPRLKHYSFLCRFTQNGNSCEDLFDQIISNTCLLDTCNMDRKGNPEVLLRCTLTAGGNGIHNEIEIVHLLDVSHQTPLLLLSALVEDETKGMGGLGGQYQERGYRRHLKFGRKLRVGALKTSDEDGWNYFAKAAFGTIKAGRYRYRSGHLVRVAG